jgi:hypothetical protein
MYVGSNSIVKVAAFLGGFQYALEKLGLGQGDNFLSDIQELVQDRYEVKISQSWENIILFQSSDDNEAMDIFWRLFDEVCSAKQDQNLKAS